MRITGHNVPIRRRWIFITYSSHCTFTSRLGCIWAPNSPISTSSFGCIFSSKSNISRYVSSILKLQVSLHEACCQLTRSCDINLIPCYTHTSFATIECRLFLFISTTKKRTTPQRSTHPYNSAHTTLLIPLCTTEANVVQIGNNNNKKKEESQEETQIKEWHMSIW